jgi:hypothetical protein
MNVSYVLVLVSLDCACKQVIDLHVPKLYKKNIRQKKHKTKKHKTDDNIYIIPC